MPAASAALTAHSMLSGSSGFWQRSFSASAIASAAAPFFTRPMIFWRAIMQLSFAPKPVLPLRWKFAICAVRRSLRVSSTSGAALTASMSMSIASS